MVVWRGEGGREGERVSMLGRGGKEVGACVCGVRGDCGGGGGRGVAREV